MIKKILFFSDIDDTLIQTKRKTDFSKKTVVASYDKDGNESSFFYEGTKVFIDTIIESGISFIPTTARNLSSYQRTVFYKNKKIKYAILNFGGLILVNNKVDQEWEAYISQQYKNTFSIKTIFDALKELLKESSIQLKIIDNYYISIYNKNDLDNIEVLKNLKSTLHTFLSKYTEYYLYENGNSFGILPNFLNKQFAVEYLINKESPILSIGAGDNISDLDFMRLTDFKLLPHNNLF